MAAAASFAVGDLVEVLPGCELVGGIGQGDQGVVQSLRPGDNDGDAQQRVTVVWSRTGAASAVPPVSLASCVKVLGRQVLDVGDVVQALPSTAFALDGQQHYQEGDEGTVIDAVTGVGAADSVRIAWSRTGYISNFDATAWMTFCKLLRKSAAGGAGIPLHVGLRATLYGLQGAAHLNGLVVSLLSWDADKGRWLVRLEGGEEKLIKAANLAALGQRPESKDTAELAVGDLVVALPGNSMEGFYSAGDQGTVHKIFSNADGEERVHIVWSQSGKALGCRKANWAASLERLRPQSLGLGDVVQALPGAQVSAGGMDCYRPGDEGVVQHMSSRDGAEEHVMVCWSRTGTVSEFPLAAWMCFLRLLRKDDGSFAKAGPAADSKAFNPIVWKPGEVGVIHSLKGAAQHNGSQAKLLSFDAAKGRWLIELITDEVVVDPITLSVKPVNLMRP
eukprot:TRINITY_DN47787_c0_g2_i3.p1 TRINITY_DN47787_c0_g2~~TRINITY_DN47787_c0_g2_i3.p1  ORF type:complete len:447 (-),score=98.58 TRINITY_DN47787_c0_g2_i3:62-1402(-)